MASIIPTITSDLSLLTDAELTRATDRAYREAARCWADYRRSPSGDVGRMLLTAAESADEWFEQLRDEQAARLAEPVEDRSSDVYSLADGGSTTIPQPTKSVVTSPWVRNAASHELPYRIEGGSARDDEQVAS